ncbi:hypothetical protein N7468_000881 [Penicillium chermesinum]|uniref:Uncharacterized protein n=1 Tax=Penicillium chermesinum TaxID=63820 RepID=A0A9W9PFI5_9EURO|nr:uncharacterized protein N7468_000881 [Penicillium chermesinum]KAJ5245898.1 hypothetical protein N7468_000881 [Penicillium chermesinum]
MQSRAPAWRPFFIWIRNAPKTLKYAERDQRPESGLGSRVPLGVGARAQGCLSLLPATDDTQRTCPMCQTEDHSQLLCLFKRLHAYPEIIWSM